MRGIIEFFQNIPKSGDGGRHQLLNVEISFYFPHLISYWPMMTMA